jgi:hypothetical protein
MAGPEPLYYLAIDGTDAKDAALFGALLEGRGWQNLATTFLKPAPDDPGRLVDPAHDFLPIMFVEARGKKVAIVAPNGTNGEGLDPFWKYYQGEEKTRDGEVVMGRYAAAEKSGKFMSELILTPAVHTHEFEPDVLSRHLADPRLPYISRHPSSARLLYISSHGFLSGLMQGNVLKKDSSQPPLTQHQYDPRAGYFLLGAIEAKGVGFHGPEWMVFGQCSTVNSTGWPLWARILGRSSPGVRGILAYEEAAPSADEAIRISEGFFRYLDRGATFLDAWIEANRDIKWSAIVHKEARTDTLRSFPRFGRLSSVATSKNRANYRGYLSSLSVNGEAIYDKPPPFGFKLEHSAGHGLEEITPANLGDPVAQFAAGDLYRLTVTSPDGSVARKATITAVHIRLTLTDRQIPWADLFSEYRLSGGTKLQGFETTTVTLVSHADHEEPSIALRVISKHPAATPLQPGHSYVWFRVALTTDSGSHQYDFKTQGLSY